METFFTSDLHLGHEHILATRTQFKDIFEHDQFLIDQWNKRIRKNDVVYILGDLSYRSPHHISYYLTRMNGQKHLIVGNHDIYWKKHVIDMAEYFESVDYLKTIKFSKKQVTLCHYPMLEWPGSRYVESGNSFLIHGHIHDSKGGTYEYIKAHLPHALNAGVDVNGYEPVTFEELIGNNIKWYSRKEN